MKGQNRDLSDAERPVSEVLREIADETSDEINAERLRGLALRLDAPMNCSQAAVVKPCWHAVIDATRDGTCQP